MSATKEIAEAERGLAEAHTVTLDGQDDDFIALACEQQAENELPASSTRVLLAQAAKRLKRAKGGAF